MKYLILILLAVPTIAWAQNDLSYIESFRKATPTRAPTIDKTYWGDSQGTNARGQFWTYDSSEGLYQNHTTGEVQLQERVIIEDRRNTGYRSYPSIFDKRYPSAFDR